MSRRKKNSLAFQIGIVIGRQFGVPLGFLAVALIGTVVLSIFELLAAFVQAAHNFGIALIEGASAAGTLVIAHIVIGLLIGFALGLRAQTPQRRANR